MYNIEFKFTKLHLPILSHCVSLNCYFVEFDHENQNRATIPSSFLDNPGGVEAADKENRVSNVENDVEKDEAKPVKAKKSI